MGQNKFKQFYIFVPYFVNSDMKILTAKIDEISKK